MRTTVSLIADNASTARPNNPSRDFTFVSGGSTGGLVEIVFPANTAAAATTVQLRVFADNLNEGDETVVLSIGGATHTVTITDDDPITATLTTATVAADEGDPADFTVTLSGGTATADVVITYNNAAATGSLTIPTGTTSGTLTLTVTDDMLSEDAETLSLSLSDFTATSAGVVTVAGSATLTINDNDDIAVTIAPPARANTGQAAEFAVRMSGASAADVTVAYSVTLTVDGATVTIPSANITDTVSPIAAGARGGVISVTVPADVSVAAMGALTVTLTPGGVSVATGGGTADLGTPATATVDVTSDDPAAREARLEAPLASAGSGVGQLAAQAVAGRLAAAVGGGAGNSLTIAGRNIADSEILAAEMLAGGYATGDADLSTAELLRRSGFNLAAGDGGRGFNFWGSGEYVSAEGDHDGVDYDGDTSAFTVGIDTGWRDGLVGVAVSRSDGDVDFTVTADGMKSTLETEVTGVHPYLTRRFNKSQLWLTAGHGSGDAELVEPDARIKTDITVTTAAIGLSRAHGQLSGDISALYTRAELDAAAGDGKTLPATTADTLRVAAAGKARWIRGAFSPFVDFTVRHDSGDGDTGIAGDVGGGVEWNSPTVVVRLVGSTTIAAESAEESRASLTVRKSSGDFDLGLNLDADSNGLDTARLITGEWRF